MLIIFLSIHLNVIFTFPKEQSHGANSLMFFYLQAYSVGPTSAHQRNAIQKYRFADGQVVAYFKVFTGELPPLIRSPESISNLLFPVYW